MNLKALFYDPFESRPRPTADRIVRPEGKHHDGDRVRDLLVTITPEELTAADIRSRLEGNLWMLTPEAFRYFLPAFMEKALTTYESNSVFASELVGALTEPTRSDVVESLDRLARMPPGVGFSEGMTELLRKQQLEWFDSGAPQDLFRERVDGLTPDESRAVLAFFEALREAHGADFPFRELEVAVERHWGRFRGE